MAAPAMPDEAADRLVAAEDATHGGSVAAYISASLTLAVTLVSILTESSGTFAMFNDWSTLLDVLLIAGLGYGMSRHSRAAAVVMILYFVFAQVYMSARMGRGSGLGVGLVFLYFYGKAAWGSFVWHGIQSRYDPSYRPASKALYLIAAPFVLVALLVFAIGVAAELHLIAPTGVVAGDTMKGHEIETLIREGILPPGETVVLFYSEAFLSIAEAGNLLTDKQVISYETIDEELIIYQALYADIAGADLASGGSFFEDSTIEVLQSTGEVFYVLAPTDEGGDAKMLEEIRNRAGLNDD